MDDAGVLPRRQVRLSPQTARKQISALASVDGGEPLADSNAGLFGDFELNRPAAECSPSSGMPQMVMRGAVRLVLIDWFSRWQTGLKFSRIKVESEYSAAEPLTKLVNLHQLKCST
jgi:hypothetical protein